MSEFFNVVTFSGPRGSGKTTAAAQFLDRGYQRCTLAEPLRDLFTEITCGLKFNELDREAKEVYRPLMIDIGRTIEAAVGLGRPSLVFQHFDSAFLEARNSGSPGIVIDDLRLLRELEHIKNFALSHDNVNLYHFVFDNQFQGLDPSFPFEHELSNLCFWVEQSIPHIKIYRDYPCHNHLI